MIIELVMDTIYSAISLLTSPINIPSLPPQVTSIMATFYEYIHMGVGILKNYTHYDYLLILFGVVIAVNIALNIYNFTFYIARKIPFVNIN